MVEPQSNGNEPKGPPLNAHIELVFFDAGHTLLEPDPPVEIRYAQTASRYGVEARPEVIRARFAQLWREGQLRRERALFRTDDQGTRQFWYDFVSNVFEPYRRDFESSYDDFFEELYAAFATRKAWRLFDDVTTGLEALRRRGYRLAIISNWDRRLGKIIEAMGLAPFFEDVITSAEVGYEKPARAIFERALSACNVSAEGALHVGDSLEADVVGALGAGLCAAYLDRPPATAAAAPTGTIVVPSITELVALLPPRAPHRSLS